MRMYDIIAKKRDGKELNEEEISFFIDGYVNGNIPDYQVSALLMAIFIRGMNENETVLLTNHMAQSGEIVDLSSISGIKVDKHSTGGVGDKTTLIISAIVAACGVRVAKMSGRGLGYTGGTIDKLESIPNLKTDIERDRFLNIVNTVGASIISQSGNIAPADKKLYALRDVTATVESIPLIASSIISKKIAAGSDCILLDIKVGNGAFMKSVDQALELANVMVSIGEKVGKKTVALLTDMDRPLGNNIGNSLEVIEACEVLKGKGPKDLTDICLNLSANMLYLADKGDLQECFELAQNKLENGEAFNKLKEIVKAQEGDISVLEDYSKFDEASFIHELISPFEGYISSMDTEQCGTASMVLGAGREKKDSEIDYAAGIVLNKKVGDFVRRGELLATLFASNERKCSMGTKILLNAIKVSNDKPKDQKLILARVTKNSIEKFN